MEVCYALRQNIKVQGRSQGRVPGVLEPPFWVLKMNIISRGKMYGNPPLEIPRDEIFVFEEEQKKINLKCIAYRRLQVFDVELFRWRGKWLNADQDHLPSSAAQALQECNHEFFPNVHKLLRILCTLPITSAECERSFSTLRRLKTYLWATMTSERESGLALMIFIMVGKLTLVQQSTSLHGSIHGASFFLIS